MGYRKRNHPTVSSQDNHALHERQFFDDKDGQYDWEVCDRAGSTQPTLEATQKATKEEPSNSSVHTNNLNERVMKFDSYVEQMAKDPAMSEELRDLSG